MKITILVVATLLCICVGVSAFQCNVDEQYIENECNTCHCVRRNHYHLTCTKKNCAWTDALIKQCAKHPGKTWYVDGKLCQCSRRYGQVCEK